MVDHTSFFCFMPETYTNIKTSSFFQIYTDFECRGLKKSSQHPFNAGVAILLSHQLGYFVFAKIRF